MLTTMLLTAALLTPAVTAQPNDERAVRRYRTAVDAYAVLHRDAASALPEGGLCAGPEQLELLRITLSTQIQILRPDAQEGDIFDPDISEVLRARLSRALADFEEGPLVSPSDFDGPDDLPYVVQVNGFFPREADPPRWRALFWALPSLPAELEYRFVGRDLVLLDVEARLVVDILRDAIR
jgi:hypothetical protein